MAPLFEPFDDRQRRRFLIPLLLSILLHLLLLILFRGDWWQPRLAPEEEWFEVVPVPTPPPAKRLPIVETPPIPESPPPAKPEALAERNLQKEGTGRPTASPLEGEVETIPLAPKPSPASPTQEARPAPTPVTPAKPATPAPAAKQPPAPPIAREGDLLPPPTRATPQAQPAPTPPVTEGESTPAPPPSRPRHADLVPSWESPVYAPYTAPRAGAPDLTYPGRRSIPLDTNDDKFISYFLSIKRQIEYIWAYPEAAAQRGEHGDCVIQFTILKDGRVTNIKLLASSGFPALDREALSAVADGAPYNPIPARLATDELVVTGTFRYLLQRLRPFVR